VGGWACSNGGVIRLEFGVADLAGLRFAHSPMAEVVASVFAMRDPFFGHWRARAAPVLAGLPTLRAVVTGYAPDFLTPVPLSARPGLDDELRIIAATPLDQVAEEVLAAYPGGDGPPPIVRFGRDPAAGLAVLVREIRQYFAAAVAPVWPRLRAAAETEIAIRARSAAERGPRALVTALHPKLDWDGSALLIRYAGKHAQWGLDGHRLALLPTGFAGSQVYAMAETPMGRSLWYAPRGHGSVWEPRGAVAAPAAALSALLGPTRAAVLTLLAVPHSTGEVADVLGMAAATASHHLTTLRDAGLVAGERVGRRVRYGRTGLGDQLATR
jgi:helix-turn-helix protein